MVAFIRLIHVGDIHAAFLRAAFTYVRKYSIASTFGLWYILAAAADKSDSQLHDYTLHNDDYCASAIYQGFVMLHVL